MTAYTLTEGQDLTLNGARETSGDIVINAEGGGHDVTVNGGGQTDSIVYNGSEGVDDVTANGTPRTEITIDLGAGDDTVDINGNATSVIIGGEDNDQMSGSAGSETYVFNFSGFKYGTETTTTTHTEAVSFNSDPSAKADWRAWENYEDRLDAFKATLTLSDDGKSGVDANGTVWNLDAASTVILTGKQIANLSGTSVGNQFVYADNSPTYVNGKLASATYAWENWSGIKTVTDTVTTEVKTLTGLDGQDAITDFHAEDSFEFRLGAQDAVDFFKASLSNFDMLFNVVDTEARTSITTDDGSWSLLLDNQHLELAQVYAKIDFVI